jgi:hypothetical protein
MFVFSVCIYVELISINEFETVEREREREK